MGSRIKIVTQLHVFSQLFAYIGVVITQSNGAILGISEGEFTFGIRALKVWLISLRVNLPSKNPFAALYNTI